MSVEALEVRLCAARAHDAELFFCIIFPLPLLRIEGEDSGVVVVVVDADTL